MLFLLASCISCQTNEEITTEIVQVNYGKSFGFCAGYCIQELYINDEMVSFRTYTWTDDLSFPDINCFKNDYNWTPLLNSLHLSDIKNSDPILGCPDCADGGAEWIEIELPNDTYRITFEYLNEPDFLSESVHILSPLLASFSECMTP